MNTGYIFPLIIMFSMFFNTMLNACSAFFWSKNQQYLFGRNLDWYTGEGYIIKNNRGVTKYTYGISNTQPAQWQSLYGSITFNQIGKEFPYGGINEKGLVVEQLWLHGSTYANNNNSKTVSELEWIQYQLDNYSTVKEILENIHNLTIIPVKATVHYFVADKTGNSAVIDFVGGKAYITEKNGDWQVLTNTIHSHAKRYYENAQNQVDTVSRSSENRYCQVYANLQKSVSVNNLDAFRVLEKSAENLKNYKTYWSIVYDLNNLEVHFKSFEFQNIKTFSLKQFSFENQSKLIASNINHTQISFEDYTSQINAQLLQNSLKAMDIKLNEALANEHQMNPSKISVDSVYQKNYITVFTKFTLKNKQGNLYYTLMNGEKNFKTRKGVGSVMIVVEDKQVYSAVYAIPKGEYALAAYHDVNNNKKLDTKTFGIPKEPYGFSRNKKGLFGLPPKYKKAKVFLKENTTLEIKLK
ncbi:MAG: DUF2141 domain-containing protein [Raineya sp.]|jgi:choloylglycine hydrolase|nr:DUF2141 domain-containing protein [Raineya sp.]